MSYFKKYTLLLIALLFNVAGYTTHYPLQFSIPEDRVLNQVPTKDRDFAFITPLDTTTYIYDQEADYYLDYQRSYFAITCKKGGWDCMRHYEILANGCIPYFIGLEHCNPQTMAFLPKELILEAMHLPGVNFETRSIDHSVFDKKRYDEIVKELLEHTKNHLTTQKMAQYLLETIQYTHTKPILFLSYDTYPDYLRCLTLTGLKQLLGEQVIDYPKIGHIYKNYKKDIKKIYGKGMTYTKNIEADNTDRSSIEKRIANREFEFIIYGSLHRGLLFQDLVQAHYNTNEVIYICGEDDHNCASIAPSTHLFLREYDCLRKL